MATKSKIEMKQTNAEGVKGCFISGVARHPFRAYAKRRPLKDLDLLVLLDLLEDAYKKGDKNA